MEQGRSSPRRAHVHLLGACAPGRPPAMQTTAARPRSRRGTGGGSHSPPGGCAHSFLLSDGPLQPPAGRGKQGATCGSVAFPRGSSVGHPAANGSFTIAAVQAAPVFLDRDATVEKACRLVAEAAEKGARLVVFPEAFIPAYPLWVWYIPPGYTRPLRELYAELHANAVAVPSPATDRLCAAAAAAGVTVAVGINEVNVEASGTSLYNTLLYIGPDGKILGKHRNLVPTVGERLVHARGDGSTLAAYRLPIGVLSGLICWENYMPLARTHCTRGARSSISRLPGIAVSRGFRRCATSPKRGACTWWAAAAWFAATTSQIGSPSSSASCPKTSNGSIPAPARSWTPTARWWRDRSSTKKTSSMQRWPARAHRAALPARRGRALRAARHLPAHRTARAARHGGRARRPRARGRPARRAHAGAATASAAW